MFNLFGSKEDAPANVLFVDKVYITTAGKMSECLRKARMDPALLFIAWFNETVGKFREFFKENGADAGRIIEARNLYVSLLENCVPVFVEHYPLHAKELELAEKFQLQNVTVFSSMDEPLFKHFGSDKMIPWIKLLGMKENESIEHSYVTQSIVKGQKRIADKVLVEQSAASQGEWMEHNLNPG